MDILVSIPPEKEDHVRATKLNPVSGLTHGYWTLSGHPRFAKPGDRIWFAVYGEVVASARILDPLEEFDEVAGDTGGYEAKPAVCFDVLTVTGHEFSAPRELLTGFRGFRYVRRASKHVPIKRTRALEVVGAEKAKELHPKNW